MNTETLQFALTKADQEIKLSESRNNLLAIQIKGFEAVLENVNEVLKDAHQKIEDRDRTIKQMKEEYADFINLRSRCS